jgi:CubicO group peptidase (beta-lactamase class C family)
MKILQSVRGLAPGCVALAGLATLAAPAASADCQAAHRYSASLGGIALIVKKDGEIVCEIYSPGIEPTQSFDIASGTKSFTGLMAAAAVQDGLISLDERVADTITEWRGDNRSRITVRHLLTLTSGLANPATRGMVPTHEQTLRMGLVSAPGARFDYGPTAFQAFALLLDRKLEAAGLPVNSTRYLEERVLRPIGANVDRWLVGTDGNTIWAGGARVTPRDWALVGELIRREGEWNGEQLLDRDAMQAFFEGTTANPRYTLSFWRIGSGGVPWAAQNLAFTEGGVAVRDFIMAAGSGKQRMYVSREHGLTIIRQSRTTARGTGFSDRVFLNTLFTRRDRPMVADASAASEEDPTESPN